MAQAQNKESWAQLQIGPTLEVMRGKDRDPAPISLNEKAGRATIKMTDTADQHVCAEAEGSQRPQRYEEHVMLMDAYVAIREIVDLAT
jgi:hypothetical protein